MFLKDLKEYDIERIGSSRIFVLSDGKENVAPYSDEILPEIKKFGITVDTIAYRYILVIGFVMGYIMRIIYINNNYKVACLCFETNLWKCTSISFYHRRKYGTSEND